MRLDFQSEMVRCLADCDVAGVRRLWRHIRPHLPQPATDEETLVSIHLSRTQMEPLSFRLRAYSHSWLTERDLPSLLPDELKPKAERMYPRIVEGVGIAVGGSGEVGRAIAPLVRGAMREVVLDCFANGDREPEIVRPLMFAAKKTMVRKLLGR